MKKLIIYLIMIGFLTAYNSVMSQNLVKNGDFELGIIPDHLPGRLDQRVPHWKSNFVLTSSYYGNGLTDWAADIYDKRAADCGQSIPLNRFSNNTVNTVDNKNRHVGIHYDEFIIGELTEKILPGCNYRISFHSRTATEDTPGYSSTPYCNNTDDYTTIIDPTDVYQIEVYLAENDHLGHRLLVYSGSITNHSAWIWHQPPLTISATTRNYNRVIIKRKSTNYTRYFFIDNFKISKDYTSCKCFVGQHATVSGQFSSPYSIVQENSIYGPIDVAEFCINDPVIFDGSSSDCEDRWFVSLDDFDFSTWGNTSLYSGWQPNVGSSQVPYNIDLRSFFPATNPPIVGKIYRFNLAVGQPWASKEFFFKFKGATADGNFSSPHTVIQQGGPFGTEYCAEFCMGDPVIIDGSSSSCENSWAIEVSEFNMFTQSSTPFYNLTWQMPMSSSMVPSSIDVMSFFTSSGKQPVAGQVYHFVLGVRQPWDSKEFFFQFKCCNPPLDLGPDRTICEGSPMEYVYLPTHTGKPDYTPTIQWKYNGTNMWSSSVYQPLCGLFGGSVPKAGTYTVEIVYPGCDTLRDTIKLNIVEPECDINPHFDLEIEECKVFFWNSSVVNSPTTFVSYFWDFGDGNTSTQANPTHFYTSTGFFTATITVNGIDNCGNPCSKTYSESFQMDCDGHCPPEDNNYKSTSVSKVNNINNSLRLYPNPTKRSSEDGITVFPNPNNGMFSIYLNNPINEETKIEIFNSSGKVMLKSNYYSNEIKFDLSNEVNGIYFIKVLAGEKVFTQKIILTK